MGGVGEQRQRSERECRDELDDEQGGVRDERAHEARVVVGRDRAGGGSRGCVVPVHDRRYRLFDGPRIAGDQPDRLRRTGREE